MHYNNKTISRIISENINHFKKTMLYEDFEYQILNEGKDPVELIKYKFQGLPSDAVDLVLEIDPTKKKTYSFWALTQAKDNDELDLLYELIENGKLKQIFDYYQEHKESQLKDVKSLSDAAKLHASNDDTVLSKSNEPKTYLENLGQEVDSELANDFDIVYEDDSWLIAVPNTYEAECKLGENMKWCTANGFNHGGRSYYDKYLDDYEHSKYYVNFDKTQQETAKLDHTQAKTYPYKRYQFHFESNQFMDKNDNSVNLSEINLTEGAKDFYEEEGYDIERYTMSDEERYEEYMESRQEDFIYIANGNYDDDIYLAPEFNNDYEYDNPNEETPYYIFNGNDDDRDPISWQEFRYDSEITKINDICFIIKDVEGNENVLFKEGGRFWHLLTFKDTIISDNFIAGTDYDKQYNESSLDVLSISDDFISVCHATNRDLNVTNFFLNTQISSKTNKIAIECVDIDGTRHSLFYDDDIIIKSDYPANGKYFELNENNTIKGVYNDYQLNGEVIPKENNESKNWSVKNKLNDNVYILFNGDELRTYNIATKTFSEPFIKYSICDNPNKPFAFIFDDDGNKNWVEINEDGSLDSNIIDGTNMFNSLFACMHYKNSNKWVIYKKGNESPLGTFDEIENINDAILRTVSNGNIANFTVDDNGNLSKILDNIKNISQINQQYHYFTPFLKGITYDNIICLIETNNFNIIDSNIAEFDLSQVHYGDCVEYTKTNGKSNMCFKTSGEYKKLPFDVDKIYNHIKDGYDYPVIFENNGNIFLYSFDNSIIKFFPNGVPFNELTDFRLSYGDKLAIAFKNYPQYLFLIKGTSKTGTEIFGIENNSGYLPLEQCSKEMQEAWYLCAKKYSFVNESIFYQNTQLNEVYEMFKKLGYNLF